MLRRLALGLNVVVIATGLGFAFYRIYPAAGFALLAGGFNVLLLRPPRNSRNPRNFRNSRKLEEDDLESPRPSFVPIAFNLFLFTAGNLGLAVGLADLVGPAQAGVEPAAQLTRGYALVWMCPAFSVAGVVTAVVFFRELLGQRRATTPKPSGRG